MDNFRTLLGWGWPKFSKASGGRFSQDKRHAAGIQAFLAAVANGGEAPIPLEEILEVSEVTIRLAAAQ